MLNKMECQYISIQIKKKNPLLVYVFVWCFDSCSKMKIYKSGLDRLASMIKFQLCCKPSLNFLESFIQTVTNLLWFLQAR